MNLFPLCTASVWPTKSGVIVLRRDHVLNTFFSFRSLRARIFTINDSSTYGPFLTLWPISKISRVACGVTACGVARKAPAARHALCYAARRTSHALLSCPAPFTSPNNEFRGPFLFMPRLLALDLAPRVRGGPATRALALAAAQRMIDGVHRHAADSGAAAQPAALARLADRQQLVLGVADFADRGEALATHHPHLGRTEPQGDEVAFLRDDLGARSGAAADLPALPDLQLHIVHRGAERDLEQRHRVAGADVRAGPRDDAVAHVQSLGREDVALLAVGVVQQRDAGRPVRVVLDGRDLRRDHKLLAAEVDAPVLPLVATAHIPAGDVALVVAPP